MLQRLIYLIGLVASAVMFGFIMLSVFSRVAGLRTAAVITLLFLVVGLLSVWLGRRMDGHH